MRSSKMDLKRFLAITAVSALAATAGSVGAQSPSTSPATTDPATSTPATSPGTPAPEATVQPSEEYTKLDKDKDGTLSKKEARKNKQLSKNWSTLDANKDDKLDPAEFAQFEAMPKEPEADKSQSAPRAAPPVM